MKKFIAIVLALTLVLSLAACGGKTDDKTIKVGATPAPHAEILEILVDKLAEEGYTLEIIEFEIIKKSATRLELIKVRTKESSIDSTD